MIPTQRSLLYVVGWQRLRVSFLSKHSANGGWTTPEGVRHNLAVLEEYVKEPTRVGLQDAAEYCARLYRAISCLNATRMGYAGQGARESQQDKLVVVARDDYQAVDKKIYGRELAEAIKAFTWERVEVDLGNMYITDRKWFNAIHGDLMARRVRSTNMTHKQELTHFLGMMNNLKYAKQA